MKRLPEPGSQFVWMQKIMNASRLMEIKTTGLHFCLVPRRGAGAALSRVDALVAEADTEPQTEAAASTEFQPRQASAN